MTEFRPTRKIGVGGLSLGDAERRYLNEVIESNRLSYGPMTERLEELFARIHECRHAIFCASGTAALQLAIAALKEIDGWRDGDEVIVPSVTFVATSNAVLHSGLKPRFVDVDRRTYNLNPAQLEASITPRTRAVIPVHLMGLPADMEPILEISERRGLRVIEDSCETMFASYRGRKVGSMGAIGAFSTYVAHYIVAGIGGFATTNDPKLARIMRSLMNHGRDEIYLTIDDDFGLVGGRLQEVVSRRFSFVRLGFNFRATELEAAIGLAQLENWKTIVEARTRNASEYMANLKDLSHVLQLPYVPPDREHVFMLFPLVVRDEPKRSLVNFLEEAKIETRDLLPLIRQPVYREIFGDLQASFPVAQWLDERGFYIGCHQYLSAADREYIVRRIHEYFRRPR